MAEDERFVFDTNVVVSASLLPRSVPRKALDALDLGQISISAATLSELSEVLRRPAFDKYVSEAERDEFLAKLFLGADVVRVTTTCTDSRDPKDNKSLELALDGHAACAVSGDSDLLVLHPFRGIPIVTPQAFLTDSWRSPSAQH